MSTSIDNAFIMQFESEVHEAFQRQGSKLRPTVRSLTNVNGSTAVFQKVGRGTASTKSNSGIVPAMNLGYSSIDVTLSDYYAGDWIDQLDELKTNIDERQIIATAGAYAIGRKTDDLIVAALGACGSGQTITDGSTGLTFAKVMNAFQLLGAADVPDDGDRYAAVGWRQWSDLLQIEEFSNAQYIGTSDLPFAGTTQAKKWLGTTWIAQSGLTLTGNIRSCFWYHKTAIGHAATSEIQTDITWHGDRASHFVNNMMSQGAGLIDATGVVMINCEET